MTSQYIPTHGQSADGKAIYHQTVTPPHPDTHHQRFLSSWRFSLKPGNHVRQNINAFCCYISMFKPFVGFSLFRPALTRFPIFSVAFQPDTFLIAINIMNTTSYFLCESVTHFWLCIPALQSESDRVLYLLRICWMQPDNPLRVRFGKNNNFVINKWC